LCGQNDEVTSVSRPSKTSRFAHIDFMRAIAVLLVLLQHAGLERSLLGSAGVTMFFVISGFVITNLALAEASATGKFAIADFYLRRALKLLPPLIAFIVVPSLLLGFATSWTTVTASNLLSQVLFYYNSVRIHGMEGVLPGTDVIWSLSVEEQFYIGFAVLWLLCLKLPRPKVGLAWLAGISFVVANVLRFALAAEGELGYAPRIYFSTITRMDAIAAGVLLAVLIRSRMWERLRARVSRLTWDGLLFASVAVLACSLLAGDYTANYSWLITLHVVASALIALIGFSGSTTLLTRIFTRVSENRTLRFVGIASYSIYLVHHPLSLLIEPMVSEFHPLIAISLRFIIGLTAGVFASWLVERPIERFKNQRMKREWRVIA
jgi:peptidoglycan/LPS O-acetylase OafA/YrhL